MKKILFVCLGNICRSPMAEFIFRDMVEKRGLGGVIACASAATSTEEIGNPVYPPAKRKLYQLGINCSGKRARQMNRADYDAYDLLLGMESRNVARMKQICGGDPENKIRRLLDHAPQPRDIDDPWYTGDFDTACRDITEGCQILLDEINLSHAKD
ncbi:MAG: low molecular weight phosphotyrosine protein phosphatase [Clostridia bacterium]|nr:low molecular weight phosphotyrosine protein phosphatase [Clostridia bacterium]